MIPFVITGSSLTVILNGKPNTVMQKDEIYQEILDLLQNQKTNKVSIQDIQNKLDIFANAQQQFQKVSKAGARAIKGLKIELDKTKGTVSIKKGSKEYVMEKELSKAFLKIAKAKKSNKMLRSFLKGIADNPNPETLDNLFSFLSHNNLFITEDGYFIAYKSVRHDYKDAHSGRFCNKIGRTVEMKREDVTLNRDITCAAGLHVGSYGYSGTFSKKLMLVKINPADVVSVPHDYNGQKMRVCKYLVVDEVTHEVDFNYISKQAYYKG